MGSLEWIDLAEVRDKGWSVVNTAMIRRVLLNAGNLTS
jgi:hypothetical protein